MNKLKKVLIGLIFIALIIVLKNLNEVEATEYKWPIAGTNVVETYRDYRYYGSNQTGPASDGKYGREYIVDNTKWPNEKAYYARSESHYGMDITGINGHSYEVVSVVNGKVIATSGNRAYNPSVNYVDRNQRRTTAGLNDGGGYGNYVIIQETSTGRCFLYAHLKGGTIKVKKGDSVSVGTSIAIMGSSGDSGHMHLHFEIRTSKANTLYEYSNGTHTLVKTTESTTLDPEKYIGSEPIQAVHRKYTDSKSVKISESDSKIYIKYLYQKVLKRTGSDAEINAWAKVYNSTGSIAEVTKGIILSNEAGIKLGDLDNTSFVKKCYEIILMRSSYTENEMKGHIMRLNNGTWDRKDFINMICNSKEFVNTRLPNYISKAKESNSDPTKELASKDKLKTVGDLNADGKIDIKDASICLGITSRISAGYKFSDNYFVKYADMDGDGKVTSYDAYKILIIYSKSAVKN